MSNPHGVYVGVHFYHVPCKDSWQRAEFLRYLDKELRWYEA